MGNLRLPFPRDPAFWRQNGRKPAVPVKLDRKKSVGTVGYWLFNEGAGDTVYDLTGQNHGAINGATWVVDPQMGRCLSFDGTDDYVNAGTGSSLDMSGGDMTLALWIKPDAFGPQNNILIQRAALADSAADYVFFISNASPYKLIFNMHNGSWGANRYSTGELTTGVWQYVTVVFTNLGTTATFYIDGISSGGGNTTKSIGSHSGATLTIGRSHYAPNQSFFNGLINNVRIYNRALSAAEIWHLYTNPYTNLQPRQIWMPGIAAAAGSDIKKILSETLNNSETRATSVALNRVITETENLSEQLNKAQLLARILSESINSQEAPVTSEALVRERSDTAQIGEATLDVKSLLQAVSEAANLGETEATAGVLARILSEVAHLPSDVITASVLAKILDEVQNLSESSLSVRGLALALADTINSVEASVPVKSLMQAIDEAVDSQEVLLTVRSLGRIVADTLNLGSATSTASTLLRIVNNSLSVQEAVSLTKSLFKVYDEEVSLNEALGLALGLAQVKSEQQRLSESLVSLRSLAKVLSEAVGTAETHPLVLALSRTISETVRAVEVLFDVLGGAAVILGHLIATLSVRPAVGAEVDAKPALSAEIKINTK